MNMIYVRVPDLKVLNEKWVVESRANGKRREVVWDLMKRRRSDKRLRERERRE